MSKLKFLLALSTALLSYGEMNGQRLAGNAAPEVEVQIKSKQGNGLINVNPYTGQGAVNIPLYEYKVDNLNLGISLSYNARGIRVDQLSSSVGLGWDINIGGIIVRETKGIEDEVTTPARFKPPTPMYFQWGNLNDTLQGIMSPGALDPLHLPVDSMKFPVYDDEEHDIFHASIGGRSIQFGFKKTTSGYECVTYPESKVKIEIVTKELQNGVYVNTLDNTFTKYMGMDSTHNILTFNIIDEYGNKFYFERGDYQIKQLKLSENSFHNPNSVYYPTDNWILTKVVTYSGQQINFYYVKKFMDYAESQPEILHGYDFNGFPLEKYPVEVSERNFTGYKNHISRIDYPNGVSAIFDLGSDTALGRCDCKDNYRLKNLTIISERSSNDKNSYTYRFDQAYFNSPKFGLNSAEILIGNSCSSIQNSLDLSSLSTLTTPQLDSVRKTHLSQGLRLKLKGIRRIGTDNLSSENLYEFTYNSTSLPYRFNASKDFYGYYNGGNVIPLYFEKDFNEYDSFFLSIPMHYSGDLGDNAFELGYQWGAERNYNFNNAQACILTKIKNGVGGEDSIIYTDYHLENPPCSYGDISLYGIGCSIDPKLIGDTVNDGLVIGKIVSKNGYSSESTLTTEYTYTGGQRFYRGGYTWYLEPGTGEFSSTNFFVDGHDYYNGSNHGFDTVIIAKYGYNSIRLSKEKYVFSNLMYTIGSNTYSCIEKPTGFYFHFTSPNIKKYRMGLPLIKEEYDEWDNLMGKEIYTYEEKIVSDSILNINRIQDTVTHNTWGPIVDCWVCSNSWENRLFDYRAMFMKDITSIKYIYDPVTHVSDSMVNVKTFVYNDDHEVKGIYWKDSKGDNYAKYLKYNSDYSNSSSTTGQLTQQSYKHLLSTETWAYTSQQPPFWDSSLIDFELKAPLFYSNYLRFPATYKMIAKGPLSSASLLPGPSQLIKRDSALNLSSNIGLNLQTATLVSRYDSKGNVTEFKKNDINAYYSNLWDINFNYKIAEVGNARWNEIAFTSFESIYQPFGVSDENKGNLEFEPDNIVFCPNTPSCSAAITGKYAFELKANSNSIYSIVTNQLSAKEYIVSFWSTDNSGSNLDVSINNNGAFVSTVQTTVKNTVGNWKLHVAKFTAVQGDYIKIRNVPGSGNTPSLYMDEIRIFPVGAVMRTYTYKPLFGLGSECDENNYIISYEYDVFGRATIVRDMRGNIISKTETAIDNTDPTTTIPNPTY